VTKALHFPETLEETGIAVCPQGWWASFGMRTHADWTFLALLIIVLQAISVYMVAALVLPDISTVYIALLFARL
jgi:hypothetical protein